MLAKASLLTVVDASWSLPSLVYSEVGSPSCTKLRSWRANSFLLVTRYYALAFCAASFLADIHCLSQVTLVAESLLIHFCVCGQTSSLLRTTTDNRALQRRTSVLSWIPWTKVSL